MGRIVALLYGVVAYLVFFASFLYAIGFVGNWVVPLSVDAGGVASSFGTALMINVLLLGLFAAQHNVMARPAFKAAAIAPFLTGLSLAGWGLVGGGETTDSGEGRGPGGF